MRCLQLSIIVAALASLSLAGCGRNDGASTIGKPAQPPPAASSTDGAPPATAGSPAPRPPAPVDPAARSAYESQCVTCHGATGAGDGNMAAMLTVKPRSFASPTWSHVDFSAGEDAARAEIERVIGKGIPEAMMPGYAGAYSPDQIRAIANYVLTLRRNALGG